MAKPTIYRESLEKANGRISYSIGKTKKDFRPWVSKGGEQIIEMDWNLFFDWRKNTAKDGTKEFHPARWHVDFKSMMLNIAYPDGFIPIPTGLTVRVIIVGGKKGQKGLDTKITMKKNMLSSMDKDYINYIKDMVKTMCEDFAIKKCKDLIIPNGGERNSKLMKRHKLS